MFELKPCPFCGGKAVKGEWPNESKIGMLEAIRCQECGCRTAAKWTLLEPPEEYWNRRAQRTCQMRAGGFCSKCGFSICYGHRFCPGCGAKIEEEENADE